MKRMIEPIMACLIYLGGGVLTQAGAQEAFLTDTLESMMQSTLASYSSVVDKLQQDGTGASASYLIQTGFVPLPQAFLRRVTVEAMAKQERSEESPFLFNIAPGGSGLLGVTMKHEPRSQDERALLMANVVDRITRSIRATYTAAVVRKLQRDGAGASIDYTAQQGFVPLPAVFIRQIASDVIAKRQAKGESLGLTLRSRWNLNEQQGLQDDFEQEGWEFLAKQEQERLALATSTGDFRWKPFVKLVTVDGEKTLRYLSADPAAHQSCVSCHKQWEGKDVIKAMRERQGIEPGKVFELDELMGALSISIPVGNVAGN